LSLKTPLAKSGALPLNELIDQISDSLHHCQEIGLLTISVLSARGDTGDDWQGYRDLLDEISTFLDRFVRERLRKEDTLLAPLLTGNTHLLVLGPPREERALAAEDTARVRERLEHELRGYLEPRLDHQLHERYGVFVGDSRVRHRSGADPHRLIYYGIEQAQARAIERRQETSLRHAASLQQILATSKIDVVYQPLVNAVERRIIGYEALTRLPGGEFCSPDTLFRVAAEHGVLWSLERLCRARALQQLPPLEADQRLFLNLEPESFHDPELQERPFLEALDRAGLEPSRVVLELTERAAVRDFVAMRRQLDRLRELGFPLALDDVGSGHAGLQTIAEIRPDYLKIDMALVRNMHLDSVRREIVRSICDFATRTETLLIAEGVESSAELDSLVAAGVRCVQGFLLARPACPPEKPRWEKI